MLLQMIKTLQDIFYKTHHRLEKCSKILKTRKSLEDVKLAQARCKSVGLV